MLKSRIKTVAFALAALMSATAANAACNGYYCQDTIAQLSITDTSVYILLTNGVSGLTNCTPYSSSWITLPKTNANYASMYAALLAARLSGETVTLRPLDASPNCSLQYMTVP